MHRVLEGIGDTAKHWLDALSIGTAIGTLAGLLPPLAALFTIIWCAMQMYAWVVNKRWRPRG